MIEHNYTKYIHETEFRILNTEQINQEELDDILCLNKNREEISGLDYINVTVQLFLDMDMKGDLNVKLALGANQMSRKQGIKLAM